MATYKGIHGYRVESLASDPPAATSLGQMWYNTTSAELKYSIEGAGAWASGTAFLTRKNMYIKRCNSTNDQLLNFDKEMLKINDKCLGIIDNKEFNQIIKTKSQSKSIKT